MLSNMLEPVGAPWSQDDLLPVLGLGAGGHARVVIETLRLMGGYEVVGLLDPKPELWNTEVSGVPVLGDDCLLSELYKEGVRHAFIGLGSVGNTGPRRRLYEEIQSRGFHIVQTIHPQAVLSPSVQLGHGVPIMAAAVINAATTVGTNVVVNTGAIVEHDCVIGDHVHIASGARLASTVHIGAGTHIGLGACIRQCIRIGQQAIVGAGAVVVDNVPDNTIVVGVPARVLHESHSEG
jgi:sugar O-acyltransferase (sialic acid O-acetyltransferase NeuD family)